MQIGEVIRKYRLEKKMTQEEVARRLGVTAPAVNKWERGNTMPDITLLSPIARLLAISLDTLLGHTDALPQTQANQLVREASEKLKTEPFETVFQWAKEQLQTYPNSDYLTFYMARMLHGYLQMQGTKDAEKYVPYFVECYRRVLESGDEHIRSLAADALYFYYMGCEQFDKAESYLDYFSVENPERKRKLAAIYRKTGRTEEALRMEEELLYAGYQNMQFILYDIYHLALKEEDFQKAHWIVEKLRLLAQLFEMGEYHEISAGLELAIQEKDSDSLFAIVQRLLENTESIFDFAKSPLYAHMKLTQPDSQAEYLDMIRGSLLDSLQEEACAFTRGDARFEALLAKRGQV
ncbi:MAG: helix-turn-helix transcriptional regulator [Eubacteriales bacterium]|nr:helix-turn-helix transcriptional regulator [Eubacteriales bacterium]